MRKTRIFQYIAILGLQIQNTKFIIESIQTSLKASAHTHTRESHRQFSKLAASDFTKCRDELVSY